MTLREIAETVGITERAVHRIVSELVDEGYLKVGKQGRRNTYDVQRDTPMRHAATRHVPVRNLLDALLDDEADSGCADAA